MNYSAVLSLCLLVVGADAFVGHAPLHARGSLRRPTEARCLLPSSTGTRTSRGRTNVVTRMGDTEWTKATLVESDKVATDLHALTIKSGDIAKGYTVPGQYVQLKVGDGKANYFAIASAPSPDDSEGLLEFLIKATESTAPLVTAKTGDMIEVSPVMGNGFAVEENFSGYKYDFPIQNVVLSATGTGIAPLRAAIESGVLELPDEDDDGVFGRSCKLYWGCLDEESMPWADRMKDWDSRGVEVVPVLSEPSSSWTGRTGFVQQAIKEDGIRLPRNSGILVCGHPGMAEEVKAYALAAGVLDGRVLSNY